ncbi:MAG: SRPBCC family protein [Geodermatophilaceae bacterium]|nr:SRPBCC family protein [Geodermatophilaceae bacterium]
MTDVRRTFTVQQPTDKVVNYLRDFANTEQWDPGTVTTTRVDDGPIEFGTRWKNVSEFRGRKTELEYRLTRAEARRLTFVGENKTVTSTDDLNFGEVDGGTQIEYHAHFEFHGLAKLATPLLQAPLEKLGDQTEQQMRETINGL